MALMTYTVRDKYGTLYFRRPIPVSLRPFMPAPWTGKRDWKRSLRTKSSAEAKKPYARALTECLADWEFAERAQRGETAPRRPQGLTGSAAPEEIEADFLAALLANDEAERSEGDARRHHQTPEEREAWGLEPVRFGQRGMELDHWLVEAEQELEPLLAEYRKALARRDIAIVEPELRDYLRKRGAAVEPSTERYYQAGLAALRAHVRAYEGMLARHRGEIVETPKPGVGKGPRLSEAFATWKAGGGARGAKKPSPRTLQDAEYAVRRFTEWHGDLRLGAISREKAREFRDALAKLPTRLSREALKRPLRVLLQGKVGEGPPVHASTVNKSLQLLSAIVSHAEREGSLDRLEGFVNPFGKGIKLQVDKRGEEEREPFSTADLKAIFGTVVFTKGERPKAGGGEAAFWFPLIGLLSGARLGEIAQLRIADLRQDPETGLWLFDIGTAGGRTIKTASSKRLVPVHPELERIGLLRYRQALLDDGAGPEGSLWPDVASAVEGQKAAGWSKWFGRFLRKTAKVEEEGKVFHSFRHTFKRMARDAGVSEEMHDALTGHSGGGVGRSYGGGFGLKALAEAIAKLEAPKIVAIKYNRGLQSPRTGRNYNER